VALVGRVAVAAGLLLLGSGGATAPAPTEYEVKAAFLYNFAKYVEWPSAPAADAPFVICVLGQDPFGGLLDQTLSGKSIRERPLEVRRCAGVEEAAQAQIVFVGTSERADLPRILQALHGRPVLTVGEMDRFAERGGMVGFRVQGELVRFDINADQVAKAGLRMSSQLLKLARIVRSGNSG
jgi:hypothetical protein